jgi:hypothetical protein
LTVVVEEGSKALQLVADQSEETDVAVVVAEVGDTLEVAASAPEQRMASKKVVGCCTADAAMVVIEVVDAGTVLGGR